jgi:hypothetical protein
MEAGRPRAADAFLDPASRPPGFGVGFEKLKGNKD